MQMLTVRSLGMYKSPDSASSAKQQANSGQEPSAALWANKGSARVVWIRVDELMLSSCSSITYKGKL